VTPRPLLAAVLLLVVLLPSGCGYSLRGTLPPHIRTVGVPIFINRTIAPRVDSLITRAVVQAFSTNGRLRVVAPADADAILSGEVTGFSITPIAFDRLGNIQELRLTVTVNLTFRDVKRNVLLFQQAGVSERADVTVPAAGTNVESQTVSQEETALATAAVDIARSIVSLAVERF